MLSNQVMGTRLVRDQYAETVTGLSASDDSLESRGSVLSVTHGSD